MIRCLIVDDEPIAVRVLASHLEKVPDVEVVATCANAIEALRMVNNEQVDLIFLDIEMPEITGTDFVEALAHPPAIIFTTAHRDYAVRGFELDVVDYLLKPVSFPRLNRAVEKYRRLYESGSGGGEVGDATVESINIKVDRRTVRIELPDIMYAESLSDYIIIHTESGKYTTKLKMSDVEDQLAPHGFMRIHRSYIVSLRRVDSFTSREVQIAAEKLPISRTYRHGVMERLREAGA